MALRLSFVHILNKNKSKGKKKNRNFKKGDIEFVNHKKESKHYNTHISEMAVLKHFRDEEMSEIILK